MRLILTYAVEHSYRHDGGFSVRYHKRDELRALDQVFHMMDGKPQPESYEGGICDAVNRTTGQENRWESDYFKGRAFKNGNLHLEFKRQDLVDRFNAVAGGARLTAGPKTNA